MDLTRLFEAERTGVPFLLYRDGAGEQHIHALAADTDQVLIGRDAACDVALAWDATVSRTHAELHRVGSEWAVVDDGLSLNGTFLNADRVLGRHRLHDRDTLKVGETNIVFRAPAALTSDATKAQRESIAPGTIPPMQRRVLVALCRPSLLDSFAAPATNDAIAAEVFLSIPAVKTHLRALFARFGISELPQNQKRTMLVHLAVDAGAVSHRDLA
jgi:hypothetical protein